MSVRYLYRKVPQSKRICSYYRCQKPILRNIAQDKQGAIYHYGCLQSALDEQWRCLNCWAVFNGTEVAVDMQFGKQVLTCPFCGSSNLKRVKNR